MVSFQFGTSPIGLPIIGYKAGRGGPRVLILGGVHGNEPEGVTAAFGLYRQFTEAFSYQVNLTLVPMFNPEGVMRQSRLNSRGVDLNRNLPTKDWRPEILNPKYPPGPAPCSEPENKALVAFLEAEKPKFIISLHSWNPCLNINGNSRPIAEVIRRHTGYTITEDIGYPTPGSLGTYAGRERDIPTLTYEIERGLPDHETLRVHVPAICEALKLIEERH